MKTKQEELQPGNYIKEIEIDEHQHLFWLAILLILSNILLLFAVIYLVVEFMKWYIWLLDICILVYCIIQSVRTYKNSSKIRIYSLYDNCLVIKSLLYDTTIDLSQIFEVKPKRTLFDKLANKGTRSIEILIKSKSRDKIILRYINEDINKLCQQILDLANKCKIEKRKILLDKSSFHTENLKEHSTEEIDNSKNITKKCEENIILTKDEGSIGSTKNEIEDAFYLKEDNEDDEQ